MAKKYKVRDLRIKEKYFLDDNYLNGYARVCGVYGTAVYNSLSRHADKNQYCFPNIDLMAKQHGCSSPSIIKGIKKLEEYNIIQVYRERTKSGTWRNNGYDLLDKSLWKNNQVNDIELDTKSTSFTPPSKRGLPDQVNEVEHKDTHIKDTHNKASPSKDGGTDKNKKQSLEEFTKSCKSSPQKHIQIIGEWAEAEEPDYTTKAQWQRFIRRNLRAAKDLTPFSTEELQKAYDRMLEDVVRIDDNGKKVGFLSKYSLETLSKYI